MATQALYQQWTQAMIFNSLIQELGAEIEDADYDFSLENLQKDSFIKILN